MHFLLLGATGRTGQHVLSELLSQGHTAVALVRETSSLKSRAGLTIVKGSPLSKFDIENCLSQPQSSKLSAAIITLNTVRESDSPFAAQVSPPRFLADSCANVCDVLSKAGISRIVVMSTAGAGDSWSGLPLASKAFMGLTNVKYALRDHNILDKEIRETQMDWTLVRPTRLEYEQSTSTKPDVDTLGSTGKGLGMMDSVRTTSVAKFLVNVAAEGLYIREAVVIRD